MGEDRKPLVSRYYYGESLANFLSEAESSILGKLSSAGHPSGEQISAWEEQIRYLKVELCGLEKNNTSIYFEYVVPRLGSRIDVALIANDLLFICEFKVGAEKFDASSLDQVWDYSLDLVNFHSESELAAIVPVLIATRAKVVSPELVGTSHGDKLVRPVRCGSSGLKSLIESANRFFSDSRVPLNNWAQGSYQPTPTIVEAAKALYSGHSVDEISRNDAGAVNLTITVKAVNKIIEQARLQGNKTLVFVTGVPGAGKTLVGLDVATKHQNAETKSHAVYLSGNGPLVAVLKEALARDRVAKEKAEGRKLKKGDAKQSVKSFIQSVHHFRDEAVKTTVAPVDHVAIFDEAQRAWNMEMLQRFMKRKRNVDGYELSEPECLIEYMDRHKDWACIVCLIGGGQEINTGEGGVLEWMQAVRTRFPGWKVEISPNLSTAEYKSDELHNALNALEHKTLNRDLHLSMSMRSFRAEKLSEFVRLTLELERESAKDLLPEIWKRFPIYVSRDLEQAKSWIRQQVRGTERSGMVVSSQAQRLKPLAIDTRAIIDPVHWFLGDASDIRSSSFLEDAASEFLVQGLELDWTCVVWDGDLRLTNGEWSHNEFRGSKWQKIKKEERKSYLINSYRVLLTRARQGMVITVPYGSALDATRKPDFYNETYQYLRSIGIPELVA